MKGFLLLAIIAGGLVCQRVGAGPFRGWPMDHVCITSTFINAFRRDRSCLYEEGLCNRNVLKLINYMVDSAKNFDPNEARVLLIANKATFRRPSVVNQPTPTSTTFLQAYHAGGADQDRFWIYHVVLEYRGKIYDLDYLNYPNPISAQEYFKQMFGERYYVPIDSLPDQMIIGREKDIRVKAINAEDYRTKTRSHKITDWFKSSSRQHSIESYLRSIKQ